MLLLTPLADACYNYSHVGMRAAAIKRKLLRRKFFVDSYHWWNIRLNKVSPTSTVGIYGGTFTSIRDFSNLCQDGRLDEALQAADLLQERGIPMSRDDIYCLLQECTKRKDLAAGRRVHSLMASSGLDSISVLGDHLIRLFALCGSLLEANQVFSKVAKPSVYTWNAIISAHAKLGEGKRALELYYKMQQKGINPDIVTFLCTLKACGSIGAIGQGRLIHGQIIRGGIESEMVVGSTLVDMYAKCGSLEEARKVFDGLPKRNVVSWGAMIAGYAQNGHGHPALELYEKMQHEGIKPNKVVFLGILKACSSIGAIGQGRLIHDQIIKAGLELDMVVGNTLVDMYAKCGNLEEARKVFDKLPNQDVVSWGAMIAGYAQHGHGLAALELYEKLQQDGIKPSKVVYVCILKACGNLGAIGQGRLIHDQISRGGLKSDMVVGNTLVDMYAKCGSLEEARNVFDALPNRDVVSWGVMIAGYARYGNCRQAKQCLEDMQRQGLKPNDVIFTSMLAACSHAGLLEEGHWYFNSMIEDHGITPNIEHYTCIVDLLSRSGCLNEAEDFLQTMPIPPSIIGWKALLTGCRTYGNMELGRRSFDQIVGLDPSDASAYVLMSNIYADAHMWEDVNKIQLLRKCAGAWKKPGKAWIEVNNKVHEFIVGGKSHPQSDEIYAKLKRLSRLMKEEGYVPHLDLVLEPMPEQEKEDALCGHCEKLAIAFGLVSTPEGTTIRATKNLRVCTDCHNASKIISKIERREIIIRDVYRVHHLKDGVCSCGDYY